MEAVLETSVWLLHRILDTTGYICVIVWKGFIQAEFWKLIIISIGVVFVCLGTRPSHLIS